MATAKRRSRVGTSGADLRTGTADADGRWGPVKPVALDAIDKHILEALQADGRASFRTIARRVGVSEATVRSRYNRLHRSNAMQVTAVTNPLGLGYEAPALVAIKTSGSTEAISDQIAEWKEASYVVIVAGQFDLIVEVVCADRSHLLDVLERIRTIEGILSTETFTYLQLRKQVYNWGAGADGALWKGAGGNR